VETAELPPPGHGGTPNDDCATTAVSAFSAFSYRKTWMDGNRRIL
jgi:hypothetical protein